MNSKIIGTGGYLPTKVLTNKDLETVVDTTDDWIIERTGIKQRHIAEPGETTSSMATKASKDAIKSANISNEDIDLIVVATTTPDMVFPSTACILQNNLKIKAPAFDVQAACTGFIYAMSIADNYIKTGTCKNVLIVGAEKYSNLLDWSDRSTCVLFGDGAGSVIMGSSNNPGIISSTIGSNGNYKDLLTVNPDSDFIEMKGNDVFKIAVNTMGKIARETLDQHDLKINDVDWLIPHQANSRIISAIAKKLSLPSEKIIMTVGNHGNTSAASIPLAIDYAVESGDLKKEDTILLEAFGAGFTWGSTLLKF